MNSIASTFLRVRAHLAGARLRPQWDTTTPAVRDEASRVLDLFEHAHVFDVDDAAREVVFAAQRYMYQTIGGFPVKQVDDDRWEVGGPVTEESIAAIVDAADEVGYPDRFPFPCCWFGWEWDMDPGDILTRMGSPHDGHVADAEREMHELAHDQKVMSLGILVSSCGTVLEVLQASPPDASAWFLIVWHRDPTRASGGAWERPVSSIPWVANAFIGIVNDTRTLVMKRPSYGDRRTAKRIRKQLRDSSFMPAPYHTVELRDSVSFVTEQESGHADDGARRRYQGFRSDVRGHERVYVRRGALPLPDGLRRDLVRRGYRVYSRGDALPDDDVERLTMRGLPRKRPGEWVAVMDRWIDHFVKGPEDAPYVPKTRRVADRPDF